MVATFEDLVGRLGTGRVAIGTAVRPLREDHVIERPTMVLSLDG